MNTRQDNRYLTLREEGQEIRVLLEPTNPLHDSRPGASQLAILLKPAVVSETAALALASALLATFRSVAGVFNARPDRLGTVPGMTATAQQLISATHALACEAALELAAPRDVLASPAQLEDYIRVKLRGRSTETVLGLFLDRNCRLIKAVQFGEGTVDQAPLYPREVVRQALMLDASGVILAHNHPGGDPNPSDGDIRVTRAIADGLATVEVALHDHVIVGDYAIVSLRKLKHW